MLIVVICRVYSHNIGIDRSRTGLLSCEVCIVISAVLYRYAVNRLDLLLRVQFLHKEIVHLFDFNHSRLRNQLFRMNFGNFDVSNLRMKACVRVPLNMKEITALYRYVSFHHVIKKRQFCCLDLVLQIMFQLFCKLFVFRMNCPYLRHRNRRINL